VVPPLGGVQSLANSVRGWDNPLAGYLAEQYARGV
jgi:hypothetical protein